MPTRQQWQQMLFFFGSKSMTVCCGKIPMATSHIPMAILDGLPLIFFARGSTKQQDASKIYQNLSGAMRSGKAISMEMTSLSYHQLIPFHPLSGLLKHFLQELDPRHILPQFMHTVYVQYMRKFWIPISSKVLSRCWTIPVVFWLFVQYFKTDAANCRNLFQY